MYKMTIEDILDKISKEVCFEASPPDHSFHIKIDKYVPYICAAIHDGSNFRESLIGKILLYKHERWYEEDPETGEFISSLPITLIARDSRYEYDLNREPSSCIYDTAWGKKVWHTHLSDEEREGTLVRYINFYKVAEAIVKKIEEKFTHCIVYDIHSYNYKRHKKATPMFNLGTVRLDTVKYGKFITNWLSELEKIKIPNIRTTVAENDIFEGKGHFCTHLTAIFQNTLVLPTEIKKVYCDEITGENFPIVIETIKKGLKKAILNNTALFAQDLTNL